MARVPYLTAAQMPATHADIAAKKLNLYDALMHSPEGARAMDAMGSFVQRRSRLAPRLREMLIVQVGYLLRSPYVFAHHVANGEAVGVTPADVDAILMETRGEASGLCALERAALAMARQMTDGLAVDDDIYAVLEAELPAELLVDVAITIGHYNGVARLLGGLRIELEAGFDGYLARYGLLADA